MAETKKQPAHEGPEVRLVLLMVAALLVPSLLAVVMLAGAPQPAQADGAIFGGALEAYVPAIPNPFAPAIPLCPAHIVSHLVVGDQITPTLVGLYPLPGARFNYLWSNLWSGSLWNLTFSPAGIALLPPRVTQVAGEFIPSPYPTCATPYLVMPILIDQTDSYFIGATCPPSFPPEQCNQLVLP